MKTLEITQSKIEQPTLEVVRFDEADVIATSLQLELDNYESALIPKTAPYSIPDTFNGPTGLLQ